MRRVTLAIVLVLTLSLSAKVAVADFTFGKPVNLGADINSSSVEIDPSISADGLELFFESRRSGGHGLADIYVSRRASKDDPWGPCMNIGAPVNTANWEQAPSISADGLSLYFSNYPSVYGIDDLCVTTRASVSNPWGPPVNLGATVNSLSDEWAPSISADGLGLFFMSGRAGTLGGDDLWFTSRATKNDPWGSPVNLGVTINSSLEEAFPDVSADSRMLFFSDHMLGPWRPGGYGGQDIWVTARATTNDPWGKPMNLGPVINSSDWDFSPNISADGSTLYFCSDRPGGIGSADLWQAPIIPVVDFNANGKVDIQDLLRLIESWGKDDPSVDMAPMPWGDGKIDIADLEVFMSYWGQEVVDPALIARWKLDETDGSIAEDTASDNNGILFGGPLWQPVGGKKDGALQLDGTDDYVETGFVLDPAGGDFSVLAWIQGGAPGQVIISQTDGPSGAGEIWLGADAVEGKLMTKLRSPSGRSPASPMVADVIITDGQWHHIGIVVTEQKVRYLYVDRIRVAFDSQPVVLPSSDGDLYIGAGKSLDTGTFFSGLIDDLRIYNKALTTDEIAALAQ